MLHSLVVIKPNQEDDFIKSFIQDQNTTQSVAPGTADEKRYLQMVTECKNTRKHDDTVYSKTKDYLSTQAKFELFSPLHQFHETKRL